MIRTVLFILLLAQPMVAWSQDYPALYKVVRVSSDDVLNVRSGPGTKYPVTGSLAPDATAVEVIRRSESGRWGQINLQETVGWVALSYLQREKDEPWFVTGRSLACFGTEPFWTLIVDTPGQSMGLRHFDNPEKTYTTSTVTILEASRSNLRFAGIANSATLSATLASAQCSDGMSDQLYGLAVDITELSGGKKNSYKGCCSITP